MNFASFPYLVFLLFSVLIYFGPGKNLRPVFLLLASYLFYAFFGLGFVALMIFTTVVTFYSARLCSHAPQKNARLFWLYTGLAIDLAIFILFKYVHIIDMDIMDWPGWSAQKVLIPIGISFYTFKTLGYCVDVYKGKYAPENSLMYYAVSVSFFPQLIAGPIEKSHNIIVQLKNNEGFNRINFIEGGKLILWGFFKKLVVADSIAQVINPVFNNVRNYTGLDLVIALLAFVYQIYTDFSGYSDIAIGSAKCLGVDLPANFNKPLFSRNIFEFWRRWHITFYRWFREYIYGGLLQGKKKVPKYVTALKIAFIFFLVGLWHGASLNYILYAMVAYIFVLLDFVSRPFRLKFYFGMRRQKWLLRSLSFAGIMIMVALMSSFFRPPTLQDSFYMLGHLFKGGFFQIGLFNTIYLLFIILFFEGLQSFQLTAKGTCFEGIPQFYLRGALYAGLVLLAILVSSRPDVTFQYFQF